METLLVISDEPALAEVLSDELSLCKVQSLGIAQAKTAARFEAVVILVEKSVAETIHSLDADSAVLTFARPVRLRELLYTIRERLQGQTPAIREEITLAGGYCYYPRERLIAADGIAESVTLTEKEGDLFVKLLENKGDAVPRDRLLTQIWGYSEEVDTHTLETHIYRLRSKLRQIEGFYDIVSDEGGYRLTINK